MINFHILRQANHNNNTQENDLNKNYKIAKGKGIQPAQFEVQRGRNTRQFGTDITNLGITTSEYSSQILQKNKPLDHVLTYSTNDFNKLNELKTKMQSRPIQVDMQTQNLKMEVCNSSMNHSNLKIQCQPQSLEKFTQKHSHNALEYFEDISKSLLEAEDSKSLLYPISNYMRNQQNDINEKMRVILYNWLVDVHEKWKLSSETLYLTFNLIDRYLGTIYVCKEQLQCVGVAALLIACKYEEIYFPEISDFSEITDNSYSKQQILTVELEILSCLQFNVTVPSALRFFEVYNIYIKLEGREKSCALYFLELAAFDYCMLKYRPSLIAVSCMMLVVYKNQALKELLLKSCHHQNKDITSACHDLICMYHREDHGSKSITRKYSDIKYHNISLLDILGKFIIPDNNNL